MIGGFDLICMVRKMTDDLKLEGRNSMQESPMAAVNERNREIEGRAVMWSRGIKKGLEP